MSMIADPILSHLQGIVSELKIHASDNDADLQPFAEKIRSLTCALASTKGGLDQAAQQLLWNICSSLWDSALLSSCSQSDADLLHSLGAEIFSIIERDCDPGSGIPRCFRYVCEAALQWANAGRPEKAAWCLGRAARYGEQLEEILDATIIGEPYWEAYALELSSLYLQAANVAVRLGHQCMGNNMLARALQLSTAPANTPQAAASMALGIAEFQLSQAHDCISKDWGQGGIISMLLHSAQERLVSAATHLDSVRGCTKGTTLVAQLQERLEKVKLELAVKSAEMHLNLGDAAAGLRCLQGHRGEEISGILRLRWHILLVRAHLDLDHLEEAANMLRYSVENIVATDQMDDVGIKEEFHRFCPCWVSSFQKLLERPFVSQKEGASFPLHTLEMAALSYLRAFKGHPCWIDRLLHCFLSDDDRIAASRRLVLRLLAYDITLAVVSMDAKAQKFCHSRLHALAAQHFLLNDFVSAVDYLTAALQYATTNLRSKTAALLAACHLRLGAPHKAREYLAVASHNGSSQTCLELMIAMRVALLINPQGSEAKMAAQHMSQCSDYTPSLVRVAIHVACGPLEPTGDVAALLLEHAVQKFGSSQVGKSSAVLNEAEMLGTWVGALRRRSAAAASSCQQPPPLDTKDNNDVLAVNKSRAFCELVKAMKLATRRLKMRGLEKFSGGVSTAAVSTLAMHGYAATVEALRSGEYNACVTLASSTCVVLAEMDGDKENDVVQSRVLLLAAQALITTCQGKTSEKAIRLKLAAKFLEKSAGLAANDTLNGGECQRAGLLLQLHVAALRTSHTGMLAALKSLKNHVHQLTPQQLRSLVQAVRDAGHDDIRRQAFRMLLSLARKWIELPVDLLVVLVNLAHDAPQKVKALKAAFKSLFYNADKVRDGAPFTPDSGQVSRHWLLVNAYNCGTVLVNDDVRAAIFCFRLCDRLASVGHGGIINNNKLKPRIQAALEASLAKKDNFTPSNRGISTTSSEESAPTSVGANQITAVALPPTHPGSKGIHQQPIMALEDAPKPSSDNTAVGNTKFGCRLSDSTPLSKAVKALTAEISKECPHVASCEIQDGTKENSPVVQFAAILQSPEAPCNPSTTSTSIGLDPHGLSGRKRLLTTEAGMARKRSWQSWLTGLQGVSRSMKRHCSRGGASTQGLESAQVPPTSGSAAAVVKETDQIKEENCMGEVVDTVEALSVDST